MTFGRQVRLVCGEQSINLNDATYILQADNGWSDQDDALALRVLVKAQTMAELARRIDALEQLMQQAALYYAALVGEPLYVESKTCDALSATAEVGATWVRKAVVAGRVNAQSIAGVAAAPAALLLIEMQVSPLWTRREVAPLIVATTGGSSLTAGSDGALTVANALVNMYVTRLTWTSSTGLTVRTFWTVDTSTGNQINLVRLSGSFRAYINPNSGYFVISDETGIQATGNKILTSGRTYEFVVRLAGSNSGIWVDGVRVVSCGKALTWPTNPATYKLLDTSGACGTQTFRSIQVWPLALTDSEITDLAAWGQPPSELAYSVPPADTNATSAVYPLHNVPGQAPAGLRALLYSSGSQNYAQVRAGLHQLRLPTVKFECESATLGAATAVNSNVAASGGSQARFTPADTGWATRVTVTLASSAAAAEALRGSHRLLLAGYDSAASVQVNNVRWRLVLGSYTGDWSDERSFAAVASRGLLDLGLLTLPGGVWTDETTASNVQIEIQTQNTTGSGGGTLDLDALYVTPAWQGTALGNVDFPGRSLMLDWCETPTALLVSDATAMTFADWASWVGDDLLPPAGWGRSSLLWLYWLRNENEEAYPNDLCSVDLYIAPRWRQI